MSEMHKHNHEECSCGHDHHDHDHCHDDGCGHECGSDRSRGTWLTQTAFQCYNRA